MGSANSTIPAEPLIAAVAVAGVLGYGYVHYVQPSRPGGTDTDADTNATFLRVSKGSVLHGQKKRGRKLQLPGDATLKNLDFLDSSIPAAMPPIPPAPVTRQRQQPTAPQSQGDAVPGGFGGADTSDDAHGAPAQQQQQPEQPADVKKPRKKRGKKIVSDHPSSTPADAGTIPVEKAQVSAPAAVVAMADAQDERWTRVEARKKKAVPPQDGLSKLQTATDATTSDAGITTSVTGTSSPVTERTTTTEDELPSGLDECVDSHFAQNASVLRTDFFVVRSAQALSAASLPDAPPRVAPVRPLPGEQPAKGFAWDDYEGVQVDGDASSEDDGGWGVVRSRRRGSSILLCHHVRQLNHASPIQGLIRRIRDPLSRRRSRSHSSRRRSSARMRRDARHRRRRSGNVTQYSRLLSHLINANWRAHAGPTRPPPRRNVRGLVTTRLTCHEGIFSLTSEKRWDF